MQLLMGSPLFFSLSTSVLHLTQLTTPLSSISSPLPVLASWVLLTTGLSPISPTGLSLSLPAPRSSSYILTSSCGVPQGSVLGPILFSIYVSPIVSIVSFHGINQQQYADDTQLFVLLSRHLYLAGSAASSGVSLLFTVVHPQWSGSNTSKIEAICFGSSPRLQSISNLTFIKIVGTSVTLVYVKLLGVTFDKHLNFDKLISNVCSSSNFYIL